MKIAFIGQKDIGPEAPAGGVETYVAELATRLAALGHQVVVYSRGGRARTYKGVKIVAVRTVEDWRWAAVVSSFWATLAAARGGFDVIHYQGIGPGFFVWLARLLALFGAVRGRTSHSKIVTTFHSRDYEHRKWPWFGRWFFKTGEWVSVRLSHKVIVISRHLQEYVKARYGVVAEYLPQGVALPKPSLSGLRAYGLKSGQYILAVNRLEPHKGLEIILEAYEQLDFKIRREHPLVMVGAAADLNYGAGLRRRAGRTQSIKWLRSMSRESVAGLLTHAACFVQASQSEGLSITLLEAMAAGCPVVASDIPANREVIKNAAQRFRPGDQWGLTQALETAIKNVSPRRLASQAHAPELIKEYNWEKVAGEYGNLYQKLLVD